MTLISTCGNHRVVWKHAARSTFRCVSVTMLLLLTCEKTSFAAATYPVSGLKKHEDVPKSLVIVEEREGHRLSSAANIHESKIEMHDHAQYFFGLGKASSLAHRRDSESSTEHPEEGTELSIETSYEDICK